MTRTNPEAAARKVLAKIAATDPYFAKPSEAIVKAWGEQIAATNLTDDELLDGVAALYAVKESGFRPLPADVLNAARRLRRERFERQPLEDIEAANDTLDAKLAPLIVELAEYKTVPDKFDPAKFRRREPNPLTVSCAYCRAGIGSRCTSGGKTMQAFHDRRIHLAEEFIEERKAQ